MKLNAIGVTSSNMSKTISFYSLLGFNFPELKPNDQHIEAVLPEGQIRLMIDSNKLIKEMLGEDPKPGNTSVFALEYPSPTEVDAITAKVAEAGFVVVKQPWDAFWGQRYAIVSDPDGHKVDLYAGL